MPPEDPASGKKPDPWYGLEITGSVRNLSPSLWNMTHITQLYLNDNCLTRLPPDIGRLTELRLLDLSSNKLRALPRELGELILLEELLLNDNQLRTLPFEMGKLFHLKRLTLKGNTSLNQELLQIYQEPKGTQKLITYLLEHFAVQCPAPRPPQRPWILMDQPVDRTKPSCMFTTMCYNVLCDKYATRQLYGYCPAWALTWDYRKHYILEELKGYSADVIALQEIETEQFHDYFLKELQAEGYEGIFSPKSRAKTMSEFEKKHVDGCAIFFKTSKFSLVQEHLVEFNQLAMANAEGSDDMLNRVMTKDNIALVALLQIKEGAFDSFQPGSAGSVGSSGGTGSGPSGGSAIGSSPSHGDNVVGGSARNSDGVGGGGSSTILNANTGATITMTERPLHQQRILVCTAHIHWDPEFCDVKIIQTIMLMHELQAIANQAAKDLLINCGQNINSIKQYYLANGTSSTQSSVSSYMDTVGGGHNHIQMARSASSTMRSASGSFNKDQDDNISSSIVSGSSGDQYMQLAEQLGPDLIPLILCVDSNSLPESSVVEFLSNGGISADHPDFKELAYKDCLRKMCSSTTSGMANNQYWNQQTRTLTSNSTSIATDDLLKSQNNQLAPKDSSTNTSNGNSNQKQSIKGDVANHISIGGVGSPGKANKGSTINSETTHYSHPFSIATAYTGESAMPFTNYTLVF